MFEISSYGKLRRIPTGNILKNHISKKGYCVICVSLGSRNNKILIKMHRAVAENFIPNPENKSEVNHKDGNKQNNFVNNLEWVTNGENIKHAYDNNLIIKKFGLNNNNSKLNNNDIDYIRNNYKPYDKYFGCHGLARKFNISPSYISLVTRDMRRI